MTSPGASCSFAVGEADNGPRASVVHAHSLVHADKAALFQHADGSGVLCIADAGYLLQPQAGHHNRQKGRQRFGGVSLAGMLPGDVIADLPGTVAQRNQLHIACIFAAVQQTGMDIGALRSVVAGNQLGNDLSGDGLRREDLVGQEALHIGVQGTQMHVAGHVRREIGDDQAGRFKLHRLSPGFHGRCGRGKCAPSGRQGRQRRRRRPPGFQTRR